MKRGNGNSTVGQHRTAKKDKSVTTPSQNTINPDRGLNSDEQKQRTNQEEEDKSTNANPESSEPNESESSGDGKESSGGSKSSKKRE